MTSNELQRALRRGSLGLRRDVEILANRHVAGRRRALQILSAGAASTALPLSLLGCGGSEEPAQADDAAKSAVLEATAAATCSVIPSETAGPYPADGSLASNQRLNALVLTGIQRSDIRTSVLPGSATAAGVPMALTLQLVNTNGSCGSLAGYAIYAWHCTRDGKYSMYSSGVTGENYLRGVQVTDSQGLATFTTIFPGCYSGRWPHIHFEIYSSLAAALGNAAVGDYVKVSQLALPQSVCATVYNQASGYSASIANLAAITLATDNVFSNDLAVNQMATVTGSVSAGYAASLTVGIAA